MVEANFAGMRPTQPGPKNVLGVAVQFVLYYRQMKRLGVAKPVVGRKVEDVAARLNGTQCRNGTSSPDQLARALEAECP